MAPAGRYPRQIVSTTLSAARTPFTSRPELAFDALLTVATLAGSLLLLAHGGVGGVASKQRLDLTDALLAVASTLPLMAWRSRPLSVFAVTTCASAASMALGAPAGPPLGPTVALFLLASSRNESNPWTRRTSVVVIALFAAHFTAFAIGHGEMPEVEVAIGALVWAVAWFAGERVRLRRAEIAELRRRALRGERDAERERRLAAAEERARIARDLHDSAGHAINVIAVHAGAARLLHARDPQRSLASLETIEQVARHTVGEIDQIVRSLREGVGGDRVEAPPGLAALDALVARHTSAGLAVSVANSGTPATLSTATDQSAYRILQEALTNAARHGDGAVDVTLAYRERELELDVSNPLLGSVEGNSNGAGGGHGLTGIRERATLLGGSADFERARGRFSVRVRLPYREVGA